MFLSFVIQKALVIIQKQFCDFTSFQWLTMTTLVLFEHFQTLIADNIGIFITLLDIDFGQFWYFSTLSGVNCGQLCIFNTLSDESESAVSYFSFIFVRIRHTWSPNSKLKYFLQLDIYFQSIFLQRYDVWII